MMAAHFRYGTCNEIFGHEPFSSVCKQVAEAGYEGIEIAPFTLAEDPVSLSSARRNEIRSIIAGEGLCFVGLHWLLAAPPGLHLTTPDLALREKSWQYFDELIDLTADLAVCDAEYNAVMVVGSPKQRSTVNHMSPSEATDVFAHEIGHRAPHAESRGVRILVEPLSPDQTDVVTSLSEAIDIVKQIGSPAVQTMFDTHNAVAEQTEHSELIRRFIPHIQHVHLNEMDGRAPGLGDYDFATVLRALADAEYDGWISLEVFGSSDHPRELLAHSLQFLRKVEPETVSSQTV